MDGDSAGDVVDADFTGDSLDGGMAVPENFADGDAVVDGGLAAESTDAASTDAGSELIDAVDSDSSTGSDLGGDLEEDSGSSGHPFLAAPHASGASAEEK